MVNSKTRIVYVLLLVAVGVFGARGESKAQEVEENFNESAVFDERVFVPMEQGSSLESTLGTGVLLLDQTRTKNGRDFYEYVYQRWSAIQSDTTLIPANAFTNIGEELTVLIEEQPVPGGIGTSTIVSLSVNDVMIFQQFLQPRQDVLEEMAEGASERLTTYIQNYEQYQQQLGSEDQQGNGIF